MNLTFSKLNKNDDSVKVAEILYCTDKVLYEDLFNSVENARKIVPYLLDNPESVYCRNNFYVAKLNGKIVGIVSIVSHNTYWNFGIIKQAFMENDIKISSATICVSKYFERAFNTIGVGANACNICVDKEYRGQGIGKYMLDKVIKIAGRNNIELSVLADNDVAVGLYLSHGFKITKKYLDYGGYGKDPVWCYSMIRMAR